MSWLSSDTKGALIFCTGMLVLFGLGMWSFSCHGQTIQRKANECKSKGGTYLDRQDQCWQGSRLPLQGE